MKYLRYVLKRLLSMAVILFLATVVIFFMIRASRVDPITVMLRDINPSESVVHSLEQQFNLDKPLYVQYTIWMKGVFQGDWGIDYINKTDVKELVVTRFPITIGLVVMSMIISLVIAIPLGIICSIKKNTWIDQLISIITLFMTSMPGFLTSMVILLIVAKYFPSYNFTGTYHNFGEYISRISLPSVALSFNMIALLVRITRSSMIEQLKSNYVMTALAKGNGKINTFFKHAFHNGVIPVITISTIMMGSTIGHAVLVEQIFSLPGLGSLLISSVKSYNYPIVQMILLIMLTIFLLISFLADIIYALVDPRIKVE